MHRPAVLPGIGAQIVVPVQLVGEQRGEQRFVVLRGGETEVLHIHPAVGPVLEVDQGGRGERQLLHGCDDSDSWDLIITNWPNWIRARQTEETGHELGAGGGGCPFPG
ncbi:hypothetical protein GCM10018952_35730 [Streptosporangium vulgare]